MMGMSRGTCRRICSGVSEVSDVSQENACFVWLPYVLIQSDGEKTRQCSALILATFWYVNKEYILLDFLI